MIKIYVLFLFFGFFCGFFVGFRSFDFLLLVGFYAVFSLAFFMVFYAEVKRLENGVYFGVYWLKFHVSHSYQMRSKVRKQRIGIREGITKKKPPKIGRLNFN